MKIVKKKMTENLSWMDNYFFQTRKNEIRNFLYNDKIQFDRFTKILDSHGVNNDELRQLYSAGKRKSAIDQLIGRLELKKVSFIIDVIREAKCEELESDIFQGAHNLSGIFREVVSKRKEIVLKHLTGVKSLPFKQSEKIHVQNMSTGIDIKRGADLSFEYCEFHTKFDSSQTKLIVIEGN